jgi:hypothetical protein
MKNCASCWLVSRVCITLHGLENAKGIRGSIAGKDKNLHSSVQDNFPMGTVSFSRGEGGGEAVWA